MPLWAELEEMSGNQAEAVFGEVVGLIKGERAKGGNGRGEKWSEQHACDVPPSNDLLSGGW